MTTTSQLAEFIVGTRFEDIPRQTIEFSKDVGLSCLGCWLAGSTHPVSRMVIRLVQQMGGTPEVGVVGGGFKAPLVNAMFANGTTIHSTEWEGNTFPETVNPMTVWPVALGVGEKVGASGRQVLEALVVGYEVQARVGLACFDAYHRGLFSLSIFGTLGAAATAAKLLKLKSDQVRVALSMGASQAMGFWRQGGYGAHYVESGCSCRGGVLAALLAKEGLTADMDILDDTGSYPGFCTAIAGADKDKVDQIAESAGKPFRVACIEEKCYPCCHQLQRIAYGTLELAAAQKISADQVDSVTVEVNVTCGNVNNRPEPKSGEDWRFSAQHIVACALVYGRIAPSMTADAAALDAEVGETRKKVKVVVHPEWKVGAEEQPQVLTIRLVDGTKYSKECTTYPGHSTMPMSRQHILEKYEIGAGEVISTEHVRQLADLMLNLEEVRNVGRLMQLMTGTEQR